jgi:hypothetical protein
VFKGGVFWVVCWKKAVLAEDVKVPSTPHPFYNVSFLDVVCQKIATFHQRPSLYSLDKHNRYRE